MSILSAFNNQLSCFCGDLIRVYPEDNDLKTFKKSLEFLKKNNPRKIVEIFKVYVLPYSDQIKNCDEQFFLNETYDHITEGSEAGFTITTKIKNLWPELSENNKKTIWKYFDILTQLCIKC